MTWLSPFLKQRWMVLHVFYGSAYGNLSNLGDLKPCHFIEEAVDHSRVFINQFLFFISDWVEDQEATVDVFEVCLKQRRVGHLQPNL
jgi:hypothetical protein